MKLSIKVASLSALVLMSPLFVFAGQQPKVRDVRGSQVIDGAARAVQQGKAGGMSRDQVVRTNANRVETVRDSAKVDKNVVRPNPGDSALHK
jgi:hypothetical protein